MRYTGLRIADSIRLSKSQVVDGRTIFVRTAKTGQAVTVPVPPVVVKALAKIENGSGRYFWTGKNIRSAVPNRSRAVELFLAGASVEDVVSILGNTPHVVVKHYAPWVRERQERLERLVREIETPRAKRSKTFPPAGAPATPTLCSVLMNSRKCSNSRNQASRSSSIRALG